MHTPGCPRATARRRRIRCTRAVVCQSGNRVAHDRRGLPGNFLYQFGDRRMLEAQPLEKRFHPPGVCAGESGEGIEGGEQLIGLGVVEVENQNGNFGIGSGLGPQVTVDELQAAIGAFAGEQGVCVANFGEKSLKHFALPAGVGAPVFGVGNQITGSYPAEFANAVTNGGRFRFAGHGEPCAGENGDCDVWSRPWFAGGRPGHDVRTCSVQTAARVLPWVLRAVTVSV